jgi:hypothetical protein
VCGGVRWRDPVSKRRYFGTFALLDLGSWIVSFATLGYLMEISVQPVGALQQKCVVKHKQPSGHRGLLGHIHRSSTMSSS